MAPTSCNKEFEEILKRLDTASGLIARLQSENASLKRELEAAGHTANRNRDDELKRALVAKDDKINKLERSLAAARSDTAIVRDELAAATARIASLEDTSENDETDNRMLRKEAEEKLQKSLDEATVVVVRLQERNAALEHDLAVARDAATDDDALKRALADKDDKIKELEQVFADACDTYQEQNRIIAASEADNARLRDELVDVTEKMNDLKAEYDGVREDLVGLLNDRESQIDDLKKEVEDLTEQLRDATSEGEQGGQKNKRAKAVKLQGIIDNLKTHVARLEEYAKPCGHH